MSEPIAYQRISWNHFHRLCHRLAGKIRGSGFEPGIIVAIGRGGTMPARLLSDFLDQANLTSFKIEHYQSSRKDAAARIRYPLSADVSQQPVLLVDDVCDSGDTFRAAMQHIRKRATPGEIRTAVIHYKTSSDFIPDYYAYTVRKWRWIIYPWSLAEDLIPLIRSLAPISSHPEIVGKQLKMQYGLQLPEQLIRDLLVLMQN